MNLNKTPMKPDNQNFILAIVLSMAIIFAWQFFYVKPQNEQAALQQTQQQQSSGTAQPQLSAPGDPAAAGVVARDQALIQSQRVAIDTPQLSGPLSSAVASAFCQTSVRLP